MVVFNNALAGAAGQAGGAAAGYEIERSLRFNSGDSAYLSRSNSSLGNQRVMTFSFWLKPTDTSGSADMMLFGQDYNSSGDTVTNRSLSLVYYQGQIGCYDYGASDSPGNSGTGAAWTPGYIDGVFRDPSAWYHIVFAIDTTQATAADRCKVYVNGVQRSHSSQPVQNSYLSWTQVRNQYIGGQFVNGGYTRSLSAYLADVHFIDGQALDPTDFGEFDANNVWQPIAYTGSYGTNGFHLDFADNSTAAALGTDTSGNGNTWTVNNISVAAGAGNDSLRDSPTNGDTANDTGAGGEVPGNYCTMNPLDHKNCTFSNGNLDVTVGSNSCGRGTFRPTSGKWYFEYQINTVGNPYCGIASAGTLTNYSSENSVVVPNNGLVTFRTDGSQVQPGYTVSHNTTAIYSVAMDLDNKKVWWGKSGTWYQYDTSADQATTKAAVEAGNGAFDFSSNTSNGWTVQLGTSSNSSSYSLNTGQRAWAYPSMVPSGFKALCTANLPDPTIADGSTAMDVKLWTGDDGNPRAISGLGFSPDFVWVKQRNNSRNHALFDSVRGANKAIFSNATTAETSYTHTLLSFDSNGFSVGYDPLVNTATATYVGWAWDGGTGSPVSNTNGTITSSVRANPNAGFSIVTYTGTGSTGTVGHGLNAAPSMIFVKATSGTIMDDWACYHSSLGNQGLIRLNRNLQSATVATYWDSTSPTSTVFSVGAPIYDVNYDNTYDYVAYCWAPVEGYSAFGSYTGNGSSDGPFVYTGFRPRWILLKDATNSPSNWVIFDTQRDPYNLTKAFIRANEAYEELDNQPANASLDLLSNGFKVKAYGASTTINNSSANIVWAAFAENPFKYARAR